MERKIVETHLECPQIDDEFMSNCTINTSEKHGIMALQNTHMMELGLRKSNNKMLSYQLPKKHEEKNERPQVAWPCNLHSKWQFWKLQLSPWIPSWLYMYMKLAR